MENNNKPKLEEAGALWIKKSKTGNNFLTGSVKTKSGEEIKVIVFKNKYKTEGSNQPDYRIYFDQQLPKDTNETKKTKEKNISDQAPAVTTEDIPF